MARLVPLTRRGLFWRIGLGLYAALLAASWIVSAARVRPPAGLEPGEHALEVAAVDGPDLHPEKPVRMIYRDAGPPGAPGADEAMPTGRLPVVLLHGSPGSADDFRTVMPVLARTRRALALDLPGFGKSTAGIPDYSIRAHAAYVAALLDRLDIRRVHLVGYSMGGGVALELAVAEPGRVASIVLLASIGLQEFELTGRYWPNHAIHGAQLAALWLGHHGIPHFGRFDTAMLSVAYARNFYDTDQRPLRAALDGLEMPVLILHGRDDVLVPYEAAVEHHRRVPQSELLELRHGHFAPFADGPGVGTLVADFLARVDEGAARSKPTADAGRRTEAARPLHVPIQPRGFGLVVTVAAATAVLLGGLAIVWIAARRFRAG